MSSQGSHGTGVRGFTTDWFTARVPEIARSMGAARTADGLATARSILEIGSWEGRSARWFLERYPEATVTCVDTFEGGAEHAGMPQLADVEARFAANTAEFGDRVRVLKGNSRRVLFGLEPESFDAAYVDGCHECRVALSDVVMAFNLLKPGGVLLMDDYLGGTGEYSSRADFLRQTPRAAIDAFLDLCRGEYELLHRGYQVHVLKLHAA